MNVPDDINEIAIVGALQKYTKHLFVNQKIYLILYKYMLVIV